MNTIKSKKRKIRLPLRAYLLYILLVSFLLTGVTFSKYITSTGGGDAARVARLGKLYITENGTVCDGTVAWRIVPGVDITKNAVVNFENGETACYVFFKIDATGYTVNGREYSYNDLMKFTVADGWQSFDCDGDTVYYEVVNAGQALQKAVIADGGKLTVSEAFTAEQLAQAASDAAIHIKATAVQLGGFDSPEQAYGAVNS